MLMSKCVQLCSLGSSGRRVRSQLPGPKRQREKKREKKRMAREAEAAGGGGGGRSSEARRGPRIGAGVLRWPGLPAGYHISPSTNLTPAAGWSAPADQLQHYCGNDPGLKVSPGKWRHTRHSRSIRLLGKPVAWYDMTWACQDSSAIWKLPCGSYPLSPKMTLLFVWGLVILVPKID